MKNLKSGRTPDTICTGSPGEPSVTGGSQLFEVCHGMAAGQQHVVSATARGMEHVPPIDPTPPVDPHLPPL